LPVAPPHEPTQILLAVDVTKGPVVIRVLNQAAEPQLPPPLAGLRPASLPHFSRPRLPAEVHLTGCPLLREVP